MLFDNTDNSKIVQKLEHLDVNYYILSIAIFAALMKEKHSKTPVEIIFSCGSVQIEP